MKKILSLLIITSFLVIGIFGFTSMNHGADHSVGCIASVVSNTPCPENSEAMAVHHIQAFSSFFSVAPSIPYIFLLAPFSALFVGTGFLNTRKRNLILTNLVFWLDQHHPECQLSCPRKITRWLSLLENSPSLC